MHRSTRDHSAYRRILTWVATAVALAAGGPPAGAGEPSFERQVASVPVVRGGVAIPEPWTGGLLSPRPKLADLDGDGDLDLLIVNPGGGITHYRNDGDPATHLYRFVTDDLDGIDANSWATLADIDADGDLDLFTDGVGSVAFFRNVGSAETPDWLLEDPAFQGIQNIGIGNTPSFADLDQDGDLDYLEMEQNFGTGRYYRNDGSAQLPGFVFVTSQFACIDTFDPGAGRGATGHGIDGIRGARGAHGISVIAAADIDADDDFDLFIGDLFNTNLWFFRNDPDTILCFTKITKQYMPIETTGLNQTELGDLDADGDLDMIVGVVESQIGTDNLILLENQGTPDTPEHVVATMNLIPALDVGVGSRPALGDLDADGDLDLLVGAQDGTVLELRNTGTRAKPSYDVLGTLQDDLGLTIDAGFWAAPELIDWEGDGDVDLFLGTGNGKVRFYRNSGTPQLAAFHLEDDQFTGARGDFNAVPSLGDLDGDGDLDMLIGEFGTSANPRIFYMRNDGSTELPVWTAVSDDTDATFVFAERVFIHQPAPELLDWDQDDDLDLFLGEFDGNINYYRNDGDAQRFQLAPPDEAFAGIRIGRYSGPCFGDLDGDEDPDLLVGEENGGINLFRNLAPVPITLSRFAATDRGGWVELVWETTRESNHRGFHVDRAPERGGVPGVYVRLTERLLDGRSPYRFEDRTVEAGHAYYYRLEDQDRGGGHTRHRPVRVAVGGVPAPAALALDPVPTPIRGPATFTFSLPAAAAVRLRLHDTSGRLVRQLLGGDLAAGPHAVAWDGRDLHGRPLGAGVYFLLLEAGTGSSQAKLVVIK